MTEEDKENTMKKWSPIFDNLNISDDKTNWLKTYAQNQLDTPLISNDLSGGTFDSSDFPSLLPLSMKTAAQTIGFDLVSVQPMASPYNTGLSQDEQEELERKKKTLERKKKLRSLDFDDKKPKEEKELEQTIKEIEKRKNTGLVYFDYIYKGHNTGKKIRKNKKSI